MPNLEYLQFTNVELQGEMGRCTSLSWLRWDAPCTDPTCRTDSQKTAELLYHTCSPGAFIYSSHFCVNASFLWCSSFLPPLGFPIISLWGQYFVSPPPAHLRINSFFFFFINSFLSAHYLYFALSKLFFSQWQEKGRFPGSQEAVALE